MTIGVIGCLSATTVGGLLYLNEHVGGREGLVRTVSFYSLAIPKYIEYRMHMLINSPDDVWDKLHEETSKAGLDKIMELQGETVRSIFFFKC